MDAGPRVKTVPRAPPRDYNCRMKTRDLRIERIQPLLPPAILIEEQPLSEKGSLMITRAREEVSDILAGRSDRLLVVVGPVLGPRSGRRPGVRAPPPPAGRGAGAGSLHRDAGVLREAAHHGGLEGAHQRPAPRRQLRHQRGAAPGPPVPARPRRDRAARGLRVPRPDLAPVHHRPRDLGRHRGAHDGEPGSSRAGVGPLDAGRLQERHRRRGADRHRRGARRRPSAQLPGRHRAGARRHRLHPRQRGLPRDPARRAERPQLRRGERRARRSPPSAPPGRRRG